MKITEEDYYKFKEKAMKTCEDFIREILVPEGSDEKIEKECLERPVAMWSIIS